MTASQTLVVFDDIDSFEDYGLGILYTISQGSSDVFLTVRLGLWVLEEGETLEVKCPSRHIRSRAPALHVT